MSSTDWTIPCTVNFSAQDPDFVSCKNKMPLFGLLVLWSSSEFPIGYMAKGVFKSFSPITDSGITSIIALLATTRAPPSPFSTCASTISCLASSFTWRNTFPFQHGHKMLFLFLCRYNLPFRAASHHAVSPNCIVLPLYTDLTELKAAKEALSFSWNRAWDCGTGTLLTRRRDSTTHTPE